MPLVPGFFISVQIVDDVSHGWKSVFVEKRPKQFEFLDPDFVVCACFGLFGLVDEIFRCPGESGDIFGDRGKQN